MDEPVEQKVQVAVTGRVLKADMLRHLNACDSQVEDYERVANEGQMITEDWVKLNCLLFDWQWGVERLLSDDAQDRHARLRSDETVLPEMYEGTYESRHKRYAILWARCYMEDTSPIQLPTDTPAPTPTVAIQDDSQPDEKEPDDEDEEDDEG